jgi:hypothetical protein
MTTTNALWMKLEKNDLVQGDMPAMDLVKSPWYIKMLLAISGWLGAIFLLGFFVAVFSVLLGVSTVSFFMSLPLLLIGYYILRAPNNEFYEHLGLAISLAGQMLFVVSIIEWESAELIWLTVGIFQLILTYIMPSFLHRISSSFFAVLSSSASLAIIGMPHILGSFLIFPIAWICLHEFSFVGQYKRMKGLMYGLVISLLLLKCSHLFITDLTNVLLSEKGALITIPSWASYLIYILAVIFCAWQLLSSNLLTIQPKFTKVILLFTLILGIATCEAQGIGAGLVVLVLGFAHSNRILLGLGVISLLVYSSSYYYLMEETLLFKSGILLGIAVLMLTSRLLMNKVIPQDKDK